MTGPRALVGRLNGDHSERIVLEKCVGGQYALTTYWGHEGQTVHLSKEELRALALDLMFEVGE